MDIFISVHKRLNPSIMKKISLSAFICLVLFYSAHAQLENVSALSKDTTVRGKYTLVFVNNAAGFDTATRRRMIDVFFTVYPGEAQRFNKKTLTKVVFWIDPSYQGVAETGGGVARYNPAWLRSHPEDLDVVTHEVMHIVQDYKNYNPGWLTEGIADYVRYVYGVNNVKGDWTLPAWRPMQSYTNAYRVTARFLIWAEKKNKKLVDKLDDSMRTGTYTPQLWVTLTGKTVDELWAEYSKDPEVKLAYK